MGEALRNSARSNCRTESSPRRTRSFDGRVRYGSRFAGRASDRIATATEDAGRQLEPALAQAQSALRAMASAAESLERESKGISQSVDRAADATDDQLSVIAVETALERRSVQPRSRIVSATRPPRCSALRRCSSDLENADHATGCSA